MAREELSGNSALFFISIYDTDIRFNYWNDDLENLKD